MRWRRYKRGRVSDITEAYCIYHAKLQADLNAVYCVTWKMRSGLIIDEVFAKNAVLEMFNKCQTITKIAEDES